MEENLVAFATAYKRAVTAWGLRAPVLGNYTPQVPGWTREGALSLSCSGAADGLPFLFRWRKENAQK